MKLDVMIGPINGQNHLTFAANMVQHTYPLPSALTIGHFRRFISISHTKLNSQGAKAKVR